MKKSAGTVLIVRPQPSRGLGAFYRNLGITMVATHVQQHGLNAALVDLTFDDLDDHLGAPTGAALFSLYIDDFAQGVKAAQHIRGAQPRTLLAVGGPHATLLRESVFEVTDVFDLVGVGDCLPDAVGAIAEALRTGNRPQSRLISTSDGTARMDVLAPDYSIWPDGRYFAVYPVEFSRGCRQRCPFCTDPVLRRGIALDPVDRTIATLRTLAARHDPVWVRFVDSSMSSLGPDLTRLLTAMIDADLPVQWSAYAYPHDITPELAKLLAAAGCRALFLGIESLADGVRVGKHHTKRPEEVARAVDLLHDHGIFVHGNFIVGLPGETSDTVAQTLAGLRRARFDSIGGGPFFLTPGSTFERRPHKFGIQILDQGWPLRQHINFYDSDHEYFRTATLTQPQMRALSAAFRQQVQDSRLGCWNLSDYALLCWMSVGGHVDDLVRLWNTDDAALSHSQRLVLGVLKEKIGVSASSEAAQFVQLTKNVATMARTTVAA
ncbi:hypothetical protein C1I95_20165 [Micromonospora craterilacus]|uniref:Radical SAM core domain-containing protein n=1 Tax=Micromonospora craterilacus TaxID=1655439 RepID=A0A2W2F0Q8_9ACTN|nr:B12-binding domain-containing radical SAM protein [Micromonospora craterilacus]PZG15157.1 hypothetical protein C1I95_20165 [Micromonospora craterilacus]